MRYRLLRYGCFDVYAVAAIAAAATLILRAFAFTRDAARCRGVERARRAIRCRYAA